MNNNANHTEKDMEQLITETLDRCMSGIDTAPSLRPAVDKKLAENPRPEKSHIPVRQLILPAAALLCVLMVFFGIRMNSASRPDPVTAVENPAFALAQPTGFDPLPEEPWRKWMEDFGAADETENLHPVGLSCEKEGFRFTVEAAAVDNREITLLYTLKDLEGDRLNTPTHIWGSDDIIQDLTGKPADSMTSIFDEQEKLSIHLYRYNLEETPNPEEHPRITFSLDKLTLQDEETLYLVSHLKEYGSDMKTMLLGDAPKPTRSTPLASFTPDSRILDYTQPLDIRLHPNIILTGIGVIDGELHVQYRYENNLPLAPAARFGFHRPVEEVIVDSAESGCILSWDTDGDHEIDVEERILPWKEGNQIPLRIRTIYEIVNGDWEITVPLESIWSVLPEDPWRKWIAETDSAEKADSLRTVGLSCESGGIRFTVEAAAVDIDSADVLYTLEDLEGNRINEETHVWGAVEVMCDGAGTSQLRTNAHILYTPGRMSTRLSHFVTDGTAIPGNNQTVTFFLDDLGLLSHTVLDLAPYLAEYGDSAKAVGLDETLPNWSLDWQDHAGHSSDIPPSRILDVSSPLDISLNPNIRLDGIGIIDGQCHVRLRYVDNEPFAGSSGPHLFRPVDYAGICTWAPGDEQFGYSFRPDVCIYERRKVPDLSSEVDEREFIFPLDKGAGIPLYIRSCSGIVDGNWKVEVPFDSIWTGPEDYAGTYTPGWYESRLTYTLNEDGTAAVSGMKEDAHQVIRRIIIPAELDGHPVTSVADCAFRFCINLESVVFPDTITSIGANAFAYCKQLSSVDLPEGLQTIGEEAFIDSGLQAVTIPDTVTSIGRYAFMLNPDVRFEIPQSRDLIRYCRENGIPFTIRDSEPAAEPAEVPAEKPAE